MAQAPHHLVSGFEAQGGGRGGKSHHALGFTARATQGWRLSPIRLTLLTWSPLPRFANNVKYQLKIAMRAFHLSFIALTDSIRLQKRTFFFSVLAYSDDL